MDTPKNEAGGTFGESGRERCTHYLHSEKGVGSQSSPPFRREMREREGEIKVAEWRFLLREFGELVKRVILFDAATATDATDSRISRYRRP